MSSSTRTIAGHRLVAGLGQGGMARVYLAIKQKQLGFTKLVVLKVLREEMDLDGEMLTMFVEEARVAARLNHLHVVQTYEAGEEDGHHYIAMEYLEGQALSSIIKHAGARFPLEAQLTILCQALEGLQYVHDLLDYDGTPLGLIHRDVSPQNVFVTYTGQAKVIDFGIAKSSDSTRTINGIVKGKTGYMAPEQALPSVVPDRRTDVFAVGVMLWEALAGRRFVQRGDDEMVVLARRISGNELRIRDVCPDAPPALADVCDKAMAHDPADRFASAAAMREAIEACYGGRPPFESRQISLVLEEAFAEERTRIRRLVDEQVKATSHSQPLIDLNTEKTLTPSRRPVRQIDETRKDGPLDGPLDGPPTIFVAAVPPPTVAVQPAKGSRLAALAGVGVLVLVSTAVGALLHRADRAAPGAPPPPAATASATTAASPAPGPALQTPSDAAMVAAAPSAPVADRAVPSAVRAKPAARAPVPNPAPRPLVTPSAPSARAVPEGEALRPLDGNPWEKTK